MILRSLAAVGVLLVLMSAGWRTDFSKAKDAARAEHKLILLKFSGSDWCLPCIKMEKDVFAKDTFQHFADENLEMVNADFPRLKKHELDKAVVKQNETLAEQYDKTGHFPYTVLLDADGKVLKTWDGYQGEKPEEMIREIQLYAHAH
ncbi:thioredoxin family protein [Polluticoccus soli]|uniref:thioredoxin family protein n=1 Tax=Polluticoccus soli TaxID=3034150 RepID=UPI0023E1EF3E|nr:thioredoxin family protein [Flavipsychrobacter sp. JY13-12]